MLKKIVLRSVAGVTAVTGALAMTLATTPAVVTSAPEIRTVACKVKYPGSVATTTQLSLGRSIGTFGVDNFATAKVSRDEAGGKTPVGHVRFKVINPNGSLRRAWTVHLRGGEATVGLPRRLGAQRTYAVRARYLPPDCSIFAGSSSAPRYYTVEQAGTTTRVRARDISRGENAKVRVRVVSESPFSPGGRVRIVVKRDGQRIARQFHRLSDGYAFATFRKFRPGSYDVVVRYLGTRNFERSGRVNGFQVNRP